jgi:hypothetical protein
VSGSWTANGTIGTSSDAYRGLTGIVYGTTVTLYATRKGGSGSNGGGELVSLLDISGYNGAFAGTPNVVAIAAAKQLFAASPSPGTPPLPIAQASRAIRQERPISGTTATLSVTATGTAPFFYQWYSGNTADTGTPAGANSRPHDAAVVFDQAIGFVANSAGFANSNTATVNFCNGDALFDILHSHP